MTKYYKSYRGNYNVVSEKPVPFVGNKYITGFDIGDDVHPSGIVETDHYPAQFIPYWDEKSPTGLSKQFHDLMYEDSMSTDDFGTYDRSLGDQSIKALNALNSIQDAQMRLEEDYDPNDIDTVQKEFHPPALFHYEPERLVIEGAIVHPSLRHTAPVMMQLAKQDFPNARIVAAESLSPHSSKLARHARDLGLVEGHPENRGMQANNQMDFDNDSVRADYGPQHDYHEEVPEARVQQAKNELRQTLRERRTKKNLSPQFDHPTLFDD